MRRCSILSAICWLAVLSGRMPAAGAQRGFAPLFPGEGTPPGWKVTLWSDVQKPPPPSAKWTVENGVLKGSTPRGSWLVSEREYGDFVLELEFKLGEQGNSGVGLRFPPSGDPAFDGLEIQIVDPRYYGDDATPAQLAGSLYPLIPPAKSVYKPTEWNRCEITCQGPRIRVKLNGELIQDVNLDEQTEKPQRGSPLAERPRRGHIGFQELSRGGSQVQIRNARIKEL